MRKEFETGKMAFSMMGCFVACMVMFILTVLKYSFYEITIVTFILILIMQALMYGFRLHTLDRFNRDSFLGRYYVNHKFSAGMVVYSLMRIATNYSSTRDVIFYLLVLICGILAPAFYPD